MFAYIRRCYINAHFFISSTLMRPTAWILSSSPNRQLEVSKIYAEEIQKLVDIILPLHLTLQEGKLGDLQVLTSQEYLDQIIRPSQLFTSKMERGMPGLSFVATKRSTNTLDSQQCTHQVLRPCNRLFTDFWIMKCVALHQSFQAIDMNSYYIHR
jgi:hypothetical protein